MSTSPLVPTLPSLLVVGLVENEKEQLFTWHHLILWSKVVWLYRWEPFTLSNLCATFDADGSCGSGNTTLLFCHVRSRDDMIKGMWSEKWEPLNQSYHCVKFDAYTSCGSGDIILTFYHLRSCGDMIKWACDYITHFNISLNVNVTEIIIKTSYTNKVARDKISLNNLVKFFFFLIFKFFNFLIF